MWGWLLALAALALYGLHPVYRWRVRRFPGPRPWWLLGNLPQMVRLGQERAYTQWSETYGSTFVYWFGGVPTVVTDDPALARQVLVRNPYRHEIFSLEVGEERLADDLSLLNLRGDDWRVSRNAWHPFFSRESLGPYGPLMSQSAGRLCTKLGKAAESGEPVDIWRELGAMTMDVVGTTAFGVDFHTLPDTPAAAANSATTTGTPGPKAVKTPADQLVWAARVAFDQFGMGNPFFALVPLFPELRHAVAWLSWLLPNAGRREELAARLTMRAVTQELIHQARQGDVANSGGGGSSSGGREAGRDAGVGSAASAPKAGPTGAPADKGAPPPIDGDATGASSGMQASTSAPPGLGGVDPGSFLAGLTRAVARGEAGGSGSVAARYGDFWTSAQASTFILAGYETTANALAYTVYLLALHPEAEARLLREVDAFGTDRDPSPDDLPALPYVTAAFKEALRLYPPGTVAIREAKQDMDLGGRWVPKGTALHASIYTMHRSARYWRDPLAFLPERWLPGTPEAAALDPGAYMPFGEGARKCVGYRFAMQEAQLALVKLYQQYTFRLLPGQVPLKVRTLLTMGPVNGIQVTVHARQAAAREE